MCQALWIEAALRWRGWSGYCTEESGSFKIVDMLAEGVSMRLTVRSDYDSFITSHDDNIEALDALRCARSQPSDDHGITFCLGLRPILDSIVPSVGFTLRA
jgi:hypothetical protein